MRFCRNIGFSSIGHEEDVIMKSYLDTEKANMKTLGGSSALYFYFHLLVIHELGIIIPSMPFEANFLEAANVAPS